jgi:phosphate acyltransferase
MIAIDAMGGDYAPHAVVYGSYKAAAQGIPVMLFGKEDEIVAILNSIDSKWQRFSIEISNCSEAIGMEEEPVRGFLSKPDSALKKALESVAQLKTQAVVSAGNSGAALVAGMKVLGIVPGILRPAIGSFIPTKTGSTFCLDLGANVDCKPEHLYQFALMGNSYVQLCKKIKNPRVALLSNGQEPYKGSSVVKKAYELLSQQSSVNFIGNIEPNELFGGTIDVLVVDGFAGNVMLKSMEGTVSALKYWMKQEYEKTFMRRCAGMANRFMWGSLKKKIDYTQQGGALLLGIKYPLVIAHGCSQEIAIEQAIMLAYDAAAQAITASFNDSIQQALALDSNEYVNKSRYNQLSPAL